MCGPLQCPAGNENHDFLVAQSTSYEIRLGIRRRAAGHAYACYVHSDKLN